MATIEKYLEDPGYWLGRRQLAYLTGKYSFHWAGEAAVVLIGAGKGMGQLITAGGAGAVSAGLVQWDYYKAKKVAGEFYAEELKAKGIADFDGLAKTNGVAAEKARHLRSERNIGIGISFIATMAALAAVYFAVPAIAASFGVPKLAEAYTLIHHSDTWNAAGIGNLLINMAVGLGVYNSLKLGMYWLGDKVFGLHKETTHDLLVKLQRERDLGRAITREQVLEVFVQAHPDLNHLIAGQFGASYDRLTLADKQAAAAEIGKLVPLDHLTAQINTGETNVAELAFAVEGQVSGVHHDRMDSLKKPGRLRQAWHVVCDKMGCWFQPKPEYAGMPLLRMPNLMATDYEDNRPRRSFVQGLGRGKMDPAMGYVKLVEQLDQQPNTQASQTVH